MPNPWKISLWISTLLLRAFESLPGSQKILVGSNRKQFVEINAAGVFLLAANFIVISPLALFGPSIGELSPTLILMIYAIIYALFIFTHRTVTNEAT